MNGSYEEHLRKASEHSDAAPARCAILTVSDTRTPETDTGGSLIETLLIDAGFHVVARELVADQPAVISGLARRWIEDSQIQAIITTGGTGIARRDSTVDVVRSLLDVEIEGFGELFRMLSYQEVKAAAMLSRAVAGLVIRPAESGGDTLVFSLPGSINAIETAMNNLILPQLAHLVWERWK